MGESCNGKVGRKNDDQGSVYFFIFFPIYKNPGVGLVCKMYTPVTILKWKSGKKMMIQFAFKLKLFPHLSKKRGYSGKYTPLTGPGVYKALLTQCFLSSGHHVSNFSSSQRILPISLHLRPTHFIPFAFHLHSIFILFSSQQLL